MAQKADITFQYAHLNRKPATSYSRRRAEGEILTRLYQRLEWKLDDSFRRTLAKLTTLGTARQDAYILHNVRIDFPPLAAEV